CPAHGPHTQVCRRRICTRPPFRSTPRKPELQRLSDVDRPPPAGGSLLAGRQSSSFAATEEPGSRRLHRRRYPELLAALHHPYLPAHLPPPSRDGPRASGSSLLQHACHGRRPHYVFHLHPPARPSSVRPR